MVKETKEPIEIADISDDITPEIQKLHEESKKRYPQWAPKVDGQNLHVFIQESTIMKDYNGIGKHSTLLIMKTTNEKYPIVSFFPNDVCLKQFEKFVTGKNFGVSFDELKAKIAELTGRTFNIMFKGEKVSTVKGHQPYKVYSVIET